MQDKPTQAVCVGTHKKRAALFHKAGHGCLEFTRHVDDQSSALLGAIMQPLQLCTYVQNIGTTSREATACVLPSSV